MQEKPFGESFYPGAMVGYRRVTVTSLRHDQVRKHGTGSMVHEFYTAKDFPIPETDRTDKNDKSSPPFDPLALLKNLFIGAKSKHVKLVSQGYAIETNDMHGKPKAVW